MNARQIFKYQTIYGYFCSSELGFANFRKSSFAKLLNHHSKINFFLSKFRINFYINFRHFWIIFIFNIITLYHISLSYHMWFFYVQIISRHIISYRNHIVIISPWSYRDHIVIISRDYIVSIQAYFPLFPSLPLVMK